MDDPSNLEQDVIQFATRAVKCDENGLFETAAFYYIEAATASLSAALAGSRIPGLLEKANDYAKRAEALKTKGNAESSEVAAPLKTQQQMDMDRAYFLVEQAFEEDNAGNEEEAIELYTQAIQLCLEIRKNIQDKQLEQKLTKLATQALERAEALKHKRVPASVSKQAQSSPKRTMGPLGLLLHEGGGPARSRSPGGHMQPPVSVGGSGYTKEEITVLKTTSSINGRDYLPFMSIDMKERFAYPIPFTDKHGLLVLSPKQRSRLSKWARPDEFMESPQMILAVSSFSIKQTVVSDCSFVASLAISAQYERRFKKKLITSIIFPQNRNGEPVYNPCGKYMVKLHINGVIRKVIIDDFLPISSHGELLCSYSNNKNELWVSLMEKAYMKVMGGYDFPGSNSNIDLHALTGWIPERVAIRSKHGEFNAEKEFDRIMERFHKGHCLVTISTGQISDAAADRAGLVTTHAYAMLDIRKVLGKRVFQLKNPWSHLRWRGNFSELDTVNWTPEMKKALNFDPSSASMFDNGVFWIDYDSVMQFFDVIYLNWNPDLFSHTTCLHHTWTAKEGPKKDVYNIGDNPQYRLEVKTPGPSAVWIQLTRHITDKDDFADNKEYITVLVYKSQGNRIFYPSDPPPYKDGVINSPHYLCKIVEDAGKQIYTLVVSQYEKNNTIHYTLRAYATCEFSLTKISEPYIAKYEKRVTGQWKGRSAGGCANNKESYNSNPIYQFRIDNNSSINQVMVELRGPREYSVGFDVITVEANVTNAPGAFKKKSSGTFRPGFCVLELGEIPGGVYNIIPCTFYSGQEGPFFLNISASAPLTLTHMQ